MFKISLRLTLAVMASVTFYNFSFCQEKQDYNWIFAHKASGHNGYVVSTILNFQNNQLNKINDTTKYSIVTSSASVSDSRGNLLFYTNGCQVLQADHNLMENGDSLNFGKYYVEWWNNCKDGYNGMQDILILNDPLFENGYYIIHKTRSFTLSPIRFYIESLKYSYVDMSLNEGKGRVIKKNQVIHDDTYLCSSFLSAIHNDNGKDWWMIQMEEYDNTYYKWQINENGIALRDSQDIGPKTTRNTSSGGFAKFSPDGKKWAWYTWENGLHLFDFDRESGDLSNHVTKKIPFGVRKVFTGLEFSPNSRFLYISAVDTLLQIDLWKADLPYEVIDTYDGFQNPFNTDFIAMNLAPDCKIYMNSSSSTKSMHVINYPNKKGKECKFEQHSIDLFYTVGVLNMPNFPRLRVDEEDLCDSIELYTDVIDLSLQKANLKLYPNPVVDIAKVEAEANGLLYVYDIRGQQIKKQVVHQGDNYLDMEAYISGVYFVRFVDDNGREYRGKIVKVNND
jgi:hypothetical protein